MMDVLEKALRTTFEDYKLSKNEKYAFRELLLEHKNDDEALSFVRNRAFDLVNHHMQEGNRFDLDAYKWLEHIIKSIDSVRIDKPKMGEDAYFSPSDDCKNRIISLINGARATLDVCVFTISDDNISESLLAAHKRNIKVRIITDNDKSGDRGSDIDYLIRKSVPVVKDISDSHMHHKFALVDNKYLINGSFNWTRSASKYNNENITLLTNHDLISKFQNKFEEMWKQFS
jgi:mitochondrial cardiolipin hydrolase